ncbi:MerR family transcriptional regulator [Streptomyces sp. BE133]|uniref:MerR family transcriptional regulator n=2 Tax=Streptomyces TaxID=1883 RepID=UPI002E7647F7|nr:MerR family transcriptional regulator [Streptomyces sp. BE133]MEE1807984.1 MerR family transcriptional regulator [Streptomyces sp. BE133]
MDGDALYSIGDLARRTGLTVKTIRFYSDRGIVPPTDRNPAGYRRYGIDAVARLDLVRTLRDLGLDLPTIRKVVDRELSLPEVAAAHAEALAVQIRTLRTRHAVLTTVARRGSTPEEMDLMHKLAKLSEVERRRLIGDFLNTAFGGLDTAAGFTGIMRSMTPELPGSPGTEQVEAWLELAELSQDTDFRAVVHSMAEHHAAERARGDTTSLRRDPAATVRAHVAPALTAGITPTSPHADPIVESVMTDYAHGIGHPDDLALRQRLLTLLETANDPRRQRYLELLAVINAWPPPDDPAPAFTWFTQALRARPRSASDAAAPGRT